MKATVLNTASLLTYTPINPLRSAFLNILRSNLSLIYQKAQPHAVFTGPRGLNGLRGAY